MHTTFLEKIAAAHDDPRRLPGVREIDDFIVRLTQFLFPEQSNLRLESTNEVEQHFEALKDEFGSLLSKVHAGSRSETSGMCDAFFDQLEEVYDRCLEDGEAILAGDPAAVDLKEVVRTYPGFFAISIYRIAHLMLQLGIPYLPRIFTEYAHARTGIDIHPGAVIGSHFCIDHGTGVVIGETAVIGEHVKIYQGVTVGALSVSKSLARVKRHPTIGDRVVIYSGATILGGDVHIGSDSIIGGNVWITDGIPPNSRVIYRSHDSTSIVEE